MTKKRKQCEKVPGKVKQILPHRGEEQVFHWDIHSSLIFNSSD